MPTINRTGPRTLHVKIHIEKSEYGISSEERVQHVAPGGKVIFTSNRDCSVEFDNPSFFPELDQKQVNTIELKNAHQHSKTLTAVQPPEGEEESTGFVPSLLTRLRRKRPRVVKKGKTIRSLKALAAARPLRGDPPPIITP